MDNAKRYLLPALIIIIGGVWMTRTAMMKGKRTTGLVGSGVVIAAGVALAVAVNRGYGFQLDVVKPEDALPAVPADVVALPANQNPPLLIAPPVGPTTQIRPADIQGTWNPDLVTSLAQPNSFIKPLAVVSVGSDNKLTLDGNPVTTAQLTDALNGTAKQKSTANGGMIPLEVLVQHMPDANGNVDKVCEIVSKAGFKPIKTPMMVRVTPSAPLPANVVEKG